MLHTYSLLHSHNVWYILQHMIPSFCSTLPFINVCKIIILIYIDNIQCACYFMIYNTFYIFGLKNYSMTDYNMVHWFRISLCRTINLGASIIVVYFFFHSAIHSFIVCSYDPALNFLNMMCHGLGCKSFETVSVRCSAYIGLVPLEEDVNTCQVFTLQGKHEKMTRAI